MKTLYSGSGRGKNLICSQSFFFFFLILNTHMETKGWEKEDNTKMDVM